MDRGVREGGRENLIFVYCAYPCFPSLLKLIALVLGKRPSCGLTLSSLNRKESEKNEQRCLNIKSYDGGGEGGRKDVGRVADEKINGRRMVKLGRKEEIDVQCKEEAGRRENIGRTAEKEQDENMESGREEVIE